MAAVDGTWGGHYWGRIHYMAQNSNSVGGGVIRTMWVTSDPGHTNHITAVGKPC